MPLVEKPRPWRTRPCRHYQVGKCTLGEACHFAHVLSNDNGSDNGVAKETASEKDEGTKSRLCRNWEKDGECVFGEKCKFRHVGEEHALTEEKLQAAFEEIRKKDVKQDEDDDDDDSDVEIVGLMIR